MHRYCSCRPYLGVHQYSHGCCGVVSSDTDVVAAAYDKEIRVSVDRDIPFGRLVSAEILFRSVFMGQSANKSRSVCVGSIYRVTTVHKISFVDATCKSIPLDQERCEPGVPLTKL